MCDKIIMLDGEEVESIKSGEFCLCATSQKEILSWIVQNVRELEFDETLIINRDSFGYFVSIKTKQEMKQRK